MTYVLVKITETVADTTVQSADIFPFVRAGLPLEEQNRHIRKDDLLRHIFDAFPDYLGIAAFEVPVGNANGSGGLVSSPSLTFGGVVAGLEVFGDSVVRASSSLAGIPFQVLGGVGEKMFSIEQSVGNLGYLFHFGYNSVLSIGTNIYDLNNVAPVGFSLVQNTQILNLIRGKTGIVSGNDVGKAVAFGSGKLSGLTGVLASVEWSERDGLNFQDFVVGELNFDRLFVATPDMSTEAGFGGSAGFFDIGTKARNDDPINNLYFDRSSIRYTAASHLFRVDRYGDGLGNAGHDALLLQEGNNVFPVFDTSLTPTEIYAVGQLIQLYRAEIQIVSLVAGADIYPTDGSTFYALTNALTETHLPSNAAHLGDGSVMLMLTGAATVQPFIEVEACGVITTFFGYTIQDYIVALFLNGNEVPATRKNYQIYADKIPFEIRYRFQDIVPNSVIEARICSVNVQEFNVENYRFSIISS